MKKTILLLASSLALLSTAKAQYSYITAYDSLDVNNINSRLLLHGDMWWDPTSGLAKCHFPADSSTSIAFTGSVWVAGYDALNDLHVSAQTYRQTGCDYWPGPVSGSMAAAMQYQNAQDWGRFWKLNKTTIDSFLQLPTHTVANTPSTILAWPAKGNPYASGANGVSLSITEDMAPYVDVNGDGAYNALDGDYPLIKGDQMAWWVFSDMGPTHTQTNGLTLGIDIFCSAYAYHTGGITDNVQFYDFKINNRSALDYHDLRLAFMADMDLGYAFDDYIGYDSVHRLGIVYNGHDTDQAYGTHIPVAGVGVIGFPGDVPGVSIVPAGSFMYFNNSSDLSNPTADPQSATEYSNYMRAMFRDGSGLPGNGLYAYTGDPSVAGSNSECAANDQPGDRRFVIATNDLNLPASSSATIGITLMVVPDAGACPNVGFNSISQLADSAYALYQTAAPTAIHSVTQAGAKLMLYPNPAGSQLHVALPGNSKKVDHVSVYDVLGKAIAVAAMQSCNEYLLQTSTLAPGTYQVQVTAGGTVWNGRFVK